MKFQLPRRHNSNSRNSNNGPQRPTTTTAPARRVAGRATVETLENRRLLAGDFNAGVALPYQLDFNRSRTGLLDRDGSGTGFTWAQPNATGDEYQTRKLDLRIGVGLLRLYSVGNHFEAQNTLVNALTTRFAASSKPWVMSARVVGPLPQVDAAGEQGGLLFGPDQDNYVKLVVTPAGAGQVGVQFLDEQRFKSGYKHSLPQTVTNIGAATAIQTLDLYLSGDPTTGIVRALYRINSGAIIELPQQLTLTGDKKAAFFSNAGFGGVMAAHEQGGIDFTLDQFGIKRGVLTGEVVSGNLQIASRKIFNDVRGGSGQTVGTSVRNTGNGPVTITSLNISGIDANQFNVESTRTLPVTLAPGESLSLKITFAASAGTSLNVKTASLTVQGDTKAKTVRLRGLATAGTGGENEPSLARLMELYEIPINVGDANPNDVYIGDPPAQPNDEVVLQQLRKAGAGPVVIQPIAVFGVNANPGLRLGYYEPGSIAARTELLTVNNADVQSVNITPNGVTEFDPGAGAFGFYSIWPGFKNTDNTVRTIYSEDAFNAGFDPHEPRHIRFYPLKNADGSTVPNAYVMAHEEFPGGYDVQDFVAIVYNVTNASAGPEIGTDNLDGPPAADRMVFSRFMNSDPAFPNTAFHDAAKVRVRNSGSSVLQISSLAVTGPFSILSTTGAQSINPGKFVDVLIQFTGGATAGVKSGTLVINSNDADEAAKVINLAGYNQLRPEDNREATLTQMLNQVFGYTTAFSNAGQTFSNGGKVEAVGEEVLSPYWFRANTLLPVSVKQLTAFHTQGNLAAFKYHTKGSNTTTDLFASAGVDAQTIFPRKEGNLAQLAEGSFTPAGSTAFGFRIDNEWSDPKKNVQEQPGGGYGHHLRFYPLKGTNGQVVADTYLLIMDYQGINYDYNDNTYIVHNIRPETPGAAVPQSLASRGATFSGAKIATAALTEDAAADDLLATPKDELV